MQHSIKLNIIYSIKYLLCGMIAIFICNSTHAASQGKFGTQSSGTVEISVTIHQSINTISPNEILLNNTIGNNLATSKPFCITNNGYNKNTSVPYHLIIDRLEPINSDLNRLPFDIFLKDKNNKQLLTSGTTLSKQSYLKSNENIFNDCILAGTQISIEHNHDEIIKQQSDTAGLLLLLVSPY